jgi:excisionase family DNA binding protein
LNAQLRDLASWIPKEAAAHTIGVSTKTLEEYAKEGRLQQARYRRPTGGPPIVVYHPADVARLAEERRGPEGEPFVMPAAPTSQSSEKSQALALSSAGAGADEEMRTVAAAAVRAVRFLTLPEASAVTRLTQAYLRRLIDDGTLPAVRDRGWKVRWRDLEKL